MSKVLQQNTKQHSEVICNQILVSDPAIRFAGIATLGGDILAARYRSGILPLLSSEESQLSMMQALMHASIRRTMRDKLGNTVYATAVYQKVKRATITLFDNAKKEEMLLMVSFEKEADHEGILADKVIPFLVDIGKMPEAVR